ncbi:MAG: hypothetical protein WBX07_09875, partial [Rhodoplanes sp.]
GRADGKRSFPAGRDQALARKEKARVAARDLGVDAFTRSHSRFDASWTIGRPAGTIDRGALDAITIELHLLSFEIFNWYFGIKMLLLFLTNEPGK